MSRILREGRVLSESKKVEKKAEPKEHRKAKVEDKKTPTNEAFVVSELAHFGNQVAMTIGGNHYLYDFSKVTFPLDVSVKSKTQGQKNLSFKNQSEILGYIRNLLGNKGKANAESGIAATILRKIPSTKAVAESWVYDEDFASEICAMHEAAICLRQ